MPIHCQLHPQKKTSVQLESKYMTFLSENVFENIICYFLQTTAHWDMLHPLAGLDHTRVKLNTISWNPEMKMTLNVMVIDPHIQYQSRESENAYLMQIWWF